MTTRELRETFAAGLAAEILEAPAGFYEAFDEDNMADFLTRRWEALCAGQQVSLADHAFFPETEYWLLEESETENSAAYMMAAELPALAETPDTALCAVVFGTAMDPRVFTGTRHAGQITLTEWLWQNGDLTHAPAGTSFADTDDRRQTMAQQVYAVCDSYRE